MNGFELVDEASRLYPHMPVIFFSNYNDFSSVKKALTLHATSYILKPVAPEEFYSTMSGVLADLKVREQKEKEQQNQLLALQNLILYKLINRTRVESIKSAYPQMDLSFIYHCHLLILIHLDRDYFDVIPAEDDSFFSDDELHDILPEGSYFINLNPAQNAVILTDANRSATFYRHIAQRLTDYIQEACHTSCSIAISEYITSPEELSSAYEDLELNLAEQYFVPENPPRLTDEQITADTILAQLQDDIHVRDTVALHQHIALLFSILKSTSNYSFLYFRFICTSVLKILLNAFPPSEELSFDEYASVISRSPHPAVIETLLLRLVDKLTSLMEISSDDSQQLLCQIKQYIRKHYAEDLSLERLAKKFYLSPSYLSKFFSKYNGSGISKYIKKVRMEKAQELLLNTDLSVNEISRRVGYSSDSYFCKSFLKDFDISPEKFRSINRTTTERLGTS